MPSDSWKEPAASVNRLSGVSSEPAMPESPHRIQVIDSHTGGEPTRVVIGGFPDLGDLPLKAKVETLRFDYDRYRAAVIEEPRGSDVLVGALLLEPENSNHTAAVIFFNNAGYLGMCGHGTIGLIETLRHLDWIHEGIHTIETPVGIVEATLEKDGHVSVQNVPAYRFKKDVTVNVPEIGKVVGDIAYGGNWFFLVSDHGQDLCLGNVERLTEWSWQVLRALDRHGIYGKDRARIDHIELFGPSKVADSKNFVLCPGKAYDRSPCGTGTSAKMACLAADGKLQPGEIWRQESIIGSIFEGSYSGDGGMVIPTIRGRAFITGEATLILNPDDPYHWGFR
ncbi:MAG: 4-hydroxyproline epimerase [Fimbriimonadaceae bacterium]|nr:4-hydroxyproline epimerase [Fimbriimonadaceae bacterium]